MEVSLKNVDKLTRVPELEGGQSQDSLGPTVQGPPAQMAPQATGSVLLLICRGGKNFPSSLLDSLAR